jgi:hypothetical protein
MLSCLKKIFSKFCSENKNEAKEPKPSIDFTNDWKKTVHGELGIGREFRINYNGSRLAGHVTVEYKFSDGPDYESETMGDPDSNDIYHHTISIPVEANKVVIWFKNEGDPPEYDSNFGQNYHFPVTRPSVGFLECWRQKQHGDLGAGGGFDLFYDSRRLNRNSQVEAQMKFGGDVVVEEKLDTSSDSFYQSAGISIPDDAEKLEMWFYYVDDDGKKQYDSDFGNNYHCNQS